MSTWKEISADLIGQPCAMTDTHGQQDKDCQLVATEAHHGIFSRNVRWQKWIDNPLNAVPSCHNCNSKRVADNFASRLRWFERQLSKHGKRKLRAWLEAAPEPIKWRDAYRQFWKLVSE